MSNYDPSIEFQDSAFAKDSSERFFDSAPAFEPERYRDKYESFEFEAMTEIPQALAAFISHQHTFDL